MFSREFPVVAQYFFNVGLFPEGNYLFFLSRRKYYNKIGSSPSEEEEGIQIDTLQF